MQPKSALAQKKMVVEKQEVAKVSADQAQSIMDNLLGELDQEDDENLQQINTVKQGNYQEQPDEDDEMAFNKDDELNMKYNVAINQIQKPAESSKKRPYQEISRANPFKKQETAPPAEAKNIEVEATIVPEETPAVAVESAIEKEWREIRQHNENEKQQMMNSNSNSQFKNKEYPLKLNADGSLSFYWFDAHEESMGADIYLFGKVWQPEVNAFVSCSLKINGMERTIFALPKMKNNKARGSLSAEEEKLQKDSMIIEFN